MKQLTVLTCLLALSGHAVLAQDSGISANIGLGVQSAPGYFGDEDNDLGATGSFSLERLEFGGISVGGGTDDYGLGFHGAFRYIGAREAGDYPELAGLADIDASVELGGGIGYAAPGFEAFADLRYGVIGHESLVAEVGGDIIYRATDRLSLAAGPRALWGSKDYAQTYFGVTAAEAAASGFAAYDADEGLVSTGLQARATYQFSDDWGLVGTVRYDQLRGNAADSPITARDDSVSASIVVTRNVTFGF